MTLFRRLGWALGRHRCRLCGKIIPEENQARWARGAEYRCGVMALNRTDLLAVYDEEHELLLCARCSERAFALGAERVEAEANARRANAVKEIVAWLPEIPQLPKAVSEYKQDDGSFSTYYFGGDEFLEQV